MSKKIIHSDKAPEPIGPYSQAVQACGLLFISGQIPLNRETNEVVTDDVAGQTEMVMKNIEYIIEAAGLAMDDIVKCSIFLSNMNDFPVVNNIYGNFFKKEPPARETVEVSRLPKDVKVEISCIVSTE